jgi:hypothetical protein
MMRYIKEGDTVWKMMKKKKYTKDHLKKCILIVSNVIVIYENFKNKMLHLLSSEAEITFIFDFREVPLMNTENICYSPC